MTASGPTSLLRFENAGVVFDDEVRALDKVSFEVKEGELAVPTGHGLGVEVDQAKLREMIVNDV